MMSLRHYFVCGLLSLLLMVMEANSATSGITAAFTPFNYRGKIYYLHRDKFTTYQDAIDKCSADGAQLTVITDRRQLNELREYIKILPDISAVYVAGSDAAKDGDWVLPGSNKPLPHTYWFPPGQPFASHDYNCVVLHKYYQFRMFSFRCEQNPALKKYRFLCEKELYW